MDVKFDEDKAKREGASWTMQKLVKMKLGHGKSEIGQVIYTVEGRKVIIRNPKSKKKQDTRSFDLSEDGKLMSFTMEDEKEKRKVILKRIK